MKQILCTLIGMVGSIAVSLLGGWSPALQYLILAMIIDYISGLIVAGVFHASKKTQNGALESRVGWKGLCRKVFTLSFVVIARGVDIYLGVDYVKEAVIIGFFTNEVISIVENAGLMGVPMPVIVTRAVDLLTTKAEAKKE
ncbi:holin [Oribacterium sp. C9]|uniref:phage holin family protein n=1 Tax=Oribacterium sp. C9 TaxID=1943579 RepID=UPI00098F544E|nr:phage holin family protein [Oribacterium sp. C9]OON85932.1 holin [Oribacterium sp. C9]